MTTNEMIYSTLRTKMGKVPKYKDILADLGIEVYDSNSSTQGFWSVRYIDTGRMLVISKGYDKRVHLYGGDNGYQHTDAKDLKKFDYIGFLKCNRHKEGTPYFRAGYIDSEYRKLRSDIYEGKRDICWAEREIENLDKKIESLMKEREWQKNRLAKATNRVNMARERVDKLRQKM